MADIGEVSLYRARGTSTQPVTIHIHTELPDLGQALDADGHRQRFISEAAALATALWESLPGGTVDQLIVALMQRRASLLVVPLGGSYGRITGQ